MNEYESPIDERIRTDAAIIHKIAAQFPSGSSKAEALKRCILAYGFTLTKYGKEFAAYLSYLQNGPDDEAKRNLLNQYPDPP